jgi:hypothetical protein
MLTGDPSHLRVDSASAPYGLQAHRPEVGAGSRNAAIVSLSAQASTVFDNWYSPVSPWNTPLPSKPPIAPNSSSLIAAMRNRWCPTGCITPASTSVPSVWIATRSTPRVTVEINYPTCNARRVQVPIPANAVPGVTPWIDDDPEPMMVVMESQTGVEWDFYKITRPGVPPKSSGPECDATSNWAATVEYRYNPGWTAGLGAGGGTRGSGTWLGSGIIRPRDTRMAAGSTWDHALAFAYPGTLGTYVWPATSVSGSCDDGNSCVPAGARIQMDPTIDCTTWPSLVGEWQRQLCRTLQRFGMIVVDTGGGLATEQIASVRPYVYPWESARRWGLPSDITAYLRVIDWNKWGGRPPSLLQQMRPYWKMTARKSGSRLVVSVSNRAAPTTTRVVFRICATVTAAKPRCKSASLRGAEREAPLTFLVARTITKALRLALIAGGEVQARSIIPVNALTPTG